MIPEGHTIEDIKIREQIIRDFYRICKTCTYIKTRSTLIQLKECASKSYIIKSIYLSWPRTSK